MTKCIWTPCTNICIATVCRPNTAAIVTAFTAKSYAAIRTTTARGTVWGKAAKLGNAEAQQSLGWLYESATEPDYRRARKWYARAAAQCSRDATFAIVRLGSLHEHGLGGKKDVQAALKYYRRAAKLGDADAQNAIGFLYDTGRGVRQSYKRALKWYARAATGSFHDESCNNIGNLYHNGLGVKRDVKRAKHWYKLAVRLGNEMAERNLALL